MSSWSRLRGLGTVALFVTCAMGCGPSRSPLLVQGMDLRNEVRQDGISSILELDHNRIPAGEDLFLEVSFTIRNDATRPRLFTFTSSQEYDLVVLNSSGEEHWRWSEGRFFAMRMASKTLDQEPWIYRETVPTVDRNGQRLPPGRYTLRVNLTGTPSLENSIDFEIE